MAQRLIATREAVWMISAVGVFAWAGQAWAGMSCGEPESREGVVPGSVGGTGTSARPAASPAAVVVLELFTSEGCSSCPPADRVVSKLVRERAEKSGEARPPSGQAGERSGSEARVIVLAHHVDYWDRLGWPDRFASADATRRQRAYAGELAKTGGDSHGGVYTPQIVVNGVSGFVGSDAERVRTSIQKFGQRLANVEVKVSAAEGAKPGTLSVSAALGGSEAVPPDARVVFVITEDGLSSDVKRGENAGAKLEHDHVVRAMVSAKIEGRGAKAEIDVPRDVDRARAHVVALVQKGEGGAVLGADEVPANRAKAMGK